MFDSAASMREFVNDILLCPTDYTSNLPINCQNIIAM